MEFALSEDQRLLQSSVQGTLANVCTLDQVRGVAEGEATATDAIEAALTELGTGQLLVPEAQGGLGLGALEAALVHETLGHALAPSRFLSQCLAAKALELAGTDAQKASWLVGIADGSIRFATALTETVNRRADAGLQTEAGTLSGISLFAFDTGGASHLLTADSAGAFHIVDLNAKGLSARPLSTIDKTRAVVELTFDAVEAEPLGSVDDVAQLRHRLIALARLLLAADTLGACQNMLDQAVAYAAERKQFGRVIGSFQAVKHMCAGMAARLEPCRALIWHGAYLYDTELEKGPLMACLAKSHISEAGTFIARTATEVHGGMGFTDLLGLHYWFKRIGANRQWFGGPEALRAEAAQLQGWI